MNCVFNSQIIEVFQKKLLRFWGSQILIMIVLFLADISRIPESNVLFHVTVLSNCIFVFIELCIDLQNANCLRIFVMAIFSSNKWIWMDLICKWETGVQESTAFTIAKNYFSILVTFKPFVQWTQQTSTVCGLNYGSFSTALAQNTFIFPFTWIPLSLRNNS